MSYNLDVKKMSNEDWSFTNCKERSLYIIEYSSKTEKQLRDKLLSSKKYSEEIINKTIVFLKEHHFIDDYEYAKRYVELHKNQYSIKVLKEKLTIKGINRDIISKLFNEIEDNPDMNIDEDSLIKKLLLKKCPDYYEIKNDMDIKSKQKLYAFLARKGFSYDSISKIMNTY